MIPVIYSSAVNSTTFTSNGRGQLADAIECTVEEEINGIYQLHLVYPIDGIHAEELKALNIIKAVPAVGKAAQPFDIFRVSMPRLDRIKVDARHVSYRLNKYTLKPFSISASPSSVIAAIGTYSAEVYNFTYETSISRNFNLSVPEPTSIRKALSTITVTEQDGTVYSPEFTWNNFNVIMSKQRGTTRNVTVKYGKNLIDYKQEENIEEVITGVLPYWKGRDTNRDGVVVTGSVASVSNISSFPYRRTVPLDLSSEFKDKPTTAQLNTRARAYLTETNAGVPKVSIDVSFVDLSQSLEYDGLQSLFTASLGDTITVEYEKLNVSAQARVTRTVYDVLKDRYAEISLGDTKIRGQSAQSAVTPVKKQVSQINNAVNAITESETALIALPSGFTNNSEQRNFYYRKGNICMIGFDCTPSARVSDVTMVTLPSTCRPVKALRLSALPSLSRGTDDGNTQFVAVKADGVVTYTGSARLCQVYTFICKGG